MDMTWEFVLRIFVAAILGGVIGLEREYRAKEAGFRTHFLVALGSALFMIVSAYGFEGALVTDGHRWDVSRVAAQVVSGIGFIGAGTIIFHKSENAVRGLTTAAGVWVVAAIGLACGGGMYILAIASTILVLAGLEAFNFFLHKFDKHRNKTMLLLLLALLPMTGATAQSDSTQLQRQYTKEHPLVYEDTWDLWPYAFLNDSGEPEGYNVDLIRLIMKRLDIPYVIKLKSSEEAFEDLKNGKSDLTLGLAVGYHDEYGLYGNTAVTLFTQSVVTPKNKPVEIKTFRDLGKPGMKVFVNYTSMCYHLMLDYGWGENAVPEKDIREVIQRVSAEEEGQIVWNTLTLKWLMHRYLIDNLQLTPVNMPHGEYKFMSHNQQLLDLLDAELIKLSATEELKPLQDKWFYPERLKPETPQSHWYLLAAGGLVVLAFLVYAISYQLQSRKIKRANSKLNRRLTLILQTSHVRIWTYDIASRQFAWRNENGQVAFTYTMEEFAQRYSPEDFRQLREAIEELAGGKRKEESGERKEEPITLNLRAKDSEDGDTGLHDFVVTLSVLTRDREGRPTTIIGTKKDVTKELKQLRIEKERTLRYWSIFYTPIVGIVLFDQDGLLTNINPKACEIFDCDPEAIIDEKVTIFDLFDLHGISLDKANGFHATQFVDIDSIPEEERKVKSIRRKGRFCNEFRLLNIYGDSKELLGVFAICRDITDSVHGIDMEQEGQRRVTAVKGILNNYTDNLNRVLSESDIRLASYSPDSHTLTIYSRIKKVEHALTQTRCMTLVDDRSKRVAMRLLNSMDSRSIETVDANIRTTLRIKGGLQLEVWFHLKPQSDKNGRITQYVGLVRDFSQLRAIEQQMAKETAKVQEVENTKNSFVRNMVQEIKTPMDTVLKYVDSIGEHAPAPNEEVLYKGILDNADYLLHLIDNILYLSRLEAHMVEIMAKPSNFAETFESQCRSGWAKYQNQDTNYVVENPYEKLIVNIDLEAIGHAIGQLSANAAQHTSKGTVRARYDYIGRRLVISIDDTGEGIPQEELERLNDMEAGNTHTTKGLGLAITKELVRQMGGTVDISSEEGSGTTVYITIPCQATEIKRKR